MTENATCPGCGVPFPKAGDAASHAYQKGDSQHPWDSYEEALEAVDSEEENHQKAPGSDDDDPDDPPGVAPGGDDLEGEPDNPLLEHPSYNSGGSKSCPSCGGEMTRPGKGMVFTGTMEGNRVSGRTDESDHYCETCDIVQDGLGRVVVCE